MEAWNKENRLLFSNLTFCSLECVSYNFFIYENCFKKRFIYIFFFFLRFLVVVIFFHLLIFCILSLHFSVSSHNQWNFSVGIFCFLLMMNVFCANWLIRSLCAPRVNFFRF